MSPEYENQYIFDGHRCAVMWKQIFFLNYVHFQMFGIKQKLFSLWTVDHFSGPAPTFRS